MNDLNLSAELERNLLPYVQRRAVTWSILSNHPGFRRIYPHLVLQTYLYVKHSCPLMRLAVAALGDESHASLSKYLRSHIDEEAGHDEWLVADLQSLGISQSVAWSSLALKSVAALVGTQLYLLSENHPLAIMGYIYALEAYPPRADVLRQIAMVHKLPLQSINTFLEHSDRDIDHRRHLIDVLDAAELHDTERRAIIYSATMTAAHIGEFIEDLAGALVHATSPSQDEEVKSEQPVI